MKLLITAGGGGHFAPVLCVISSLPKNIDVLLVGRKYGLEGDKALSFEYQIAKKMGIPFVGITAGKLQRKFTRYTLPSLLKSPKGLMEAYAVVRSFKPDVVLSFGGYISVPVVFAAYILRIPVVIHEQTLEAGMANKIASYFAKKVCVSWKNSERFFPQNKIVLTGNPVKRFKIYDSRFKIKKERLALIYITGGSLGAHAINILVEGCLEKLLDKAIVYHQTGDAQQYKDYDRLFQIRNNLPQNVKKRYILTKFVDPLDVGAIMTQADLVISRAGINTVTELLYFKKPTLFIPLTYSQHNEQRKNAQFMKDLGLAEIVKQEGLIADAFLTHILDMLIHIKQYVLNIEKGKDLLIENADERIIRVLENVVRENKHASS